MILFNLVKISAVFSMSSKNFNINIKSGFSVVEVVLDVKFTFTFKIQIRLVTSHGPLAS